MKPPASNLVVLAACALLWQQTSCGGSPKTKGLETMNENQRKIHQVLALEDAAYFKVSDDDKQKLELAISDALSAGSMFSSDAPQTTYAIALPDTVNSGEHKEIPMLLGAQETGLRRWEVSRTLNTHIVLVNKNTGEVITERFADDPPGKRLIVPPLSQSDPKPSDSDRRALSSGVQRINIAPYFNLLNTSGRYSAAVVVYDHTSNMESFSVTTDDKAGVESKTPPATSSFIHNAKKIPTAEEDAISLSLYRTEANDAITAACRVSLNKHKVTLVDGKDNQKLLPVSLLLFKLDEEKPVQMDFYVPIVDAGSGNKVSMEWLVDIEKRISGSTLRGTYYGYLVSGSDISSSVRVDI